MWNRNQRTTEIFVKRKPSVVNNIGLGSKILNFNCKGSNVEPYNCGTKKNKSDFYKVEVIVCNDNFDYYSFK